jgi:hypothetical protein
MHRSRSSIGILLFLLVGISVRLLAQEQKLPSHEERAKAVNLVRLINTAENWYETGIKTEAGIIEAHGRYASWDELNISADAIREMCLKSGQTVAALVKSTEVMIIRL